MGMFLHMLLNLILGNNPVSFLYELYEKVDYFTIMKNHFLKRTWKLWSIKSRDYLLSLLYLSLH